MNRQKLCFRYRLPAIFLVVMTVCSHVSFAQEMNILQNQIKFSPIRIFNLANPGFELSYERAHGQRFSTQFSAMYLIDYFKMASFIQDIENYNGYRFMAEEKYFFKTTRKLRLYLSAETGYYHATMDTDDWFLENVTDNNGQTYTRSYEDDFKLTRQIIPADIKFGFQFIVRNFVMDFGVGMGVMFQHAAHSGRTQPGDKFDRSKDSSIFYMVVEEGWHTTPNLPVNFKIGYAF